MINVKKKERKACGSERYFCQIFFVFVGRNDPRFGLFFWTPKKKLLSRRLHENAYYILHVFVAPGKERTKEIANEKKTTTKKKNDHICNGVYDCFVALVKKYYYYYALLLEHQRKNNKESHFFARTRLPLFFFSLLSRRDAITSSRSGRL